LIQPFLTRIGNVHNTQPKVISISQSTELGTVYSTAELKALSSFAHENNMYLHMDGARISNAVAALGLGEAVLIFNEKIMENAPYFQKQTAQLFSKNRFIAAQFIALLTNDLWKEMATHSNRLASLLASEVKKIEGVKITQSVDANAVFAIIPAHAIEALRSKYRFYTWDEQTTELRWMCSFDTTEEEVLDFVSTLKQLIKS